MSGHKSVLSWMHSFMSHFRLVRLVGELLPWGSSNSTLMTCRGWLHVVSYSQGICIYSVIYVSPRVVRTWDVMENIPNKIPIATLAPLIQMGPHAQDSLVHYRHVCTNVWSILPCRKRGRSEFNSRKGTVQMNHGIISIPPLRFRYTSLRCLFVLMNYHRKCLKSNVTL